MPDKLHRLIDANINRAMEGIRVVEDIVRFRMGDKIITSTLKNLRSDLKNSIDSMLISRADLLKARNSRDDAGADLYSKGESQRTNVSQIVTSNFKRIEEALRVLEESAKLLNATFGKKFKALRYRVYDIEKVVSLPLPKIDKLDFDLYVITDPEVGKGRSHEAQAKAAIKGGAKIIQMRDKTVSRKQFLSQAKEVARLCRNVGVTFIVNDYVDIAKMVDADGVHVGQDDVPIKPARKLLGDDKIIGASAVNPREAVRAEKEGADYIGVGPVFPTPTKEGHLPIGIEVLKKIRKAVKKPVVAIGGINSGNIAQLKRAGIDRFAVINSAVGQKDIAGSVRLLKKKISGRQRVN